MSNDDRRSLQTISITGGTGFLGQHLVQLLLQRPNTLIRLLVHSSPADTLEADDRVSVVRGNLLDARSLAGFVQPGDAVVHLAYLPRATSAENLQCAANLADACLAGSAASLTHCSTAVVVGNCRETVVRESTVCQPVTPYETTKLAIEQLLLERCRPAIPVTVLRPTAVFGPGGQNLIKLARTVAQGSRLRNYLIQTLQGTRRMNAVAVENVAAAIEHLTRHSESLSGEVFFISDDEFPENNYRDIAACLTDRLRHRRQTLPRLSVPPQILGGLLRLAGRSNADPRRIWDCSRLLQTGFVKPMTFAEGLARFADWFEQSH